MYKKLLLVIVLMSSLVAEKTKRNIYEDNCRACHTNVFPLEKLYMLYLKRYSGEQTFKASLKAFLKKPLEETSVMTDKWIKDFSVKGRTPLTDKQIDEAIDIYWNLYDVRKKLK